MRLFFVFLLVAAPLLAGCASQKTIVTEQRALIDSLYVADRAMRAELYALQDSIQFYDEVRSGQYFRRQRLLEDEIDRLEYLLAARADTLCAPAALETLAGDDLFEPASATLSEAGQARLDALATRLDSVYTDHHFRVEGHADNVPLGASLQKLFASNWELSAARAAAVVRYLATQPGLDPARFEVVALGSTRPVASNATAEGRRQNRRIVLFALEGR